MDRNIIPASACVLFWGQARKSLWIETVCHQEDTGILSGQARKSLWIETDGALAREIKEAVRLVRACGSKP